jgi:hypothetical protein
MYIIRQILISLLIISVGCTGEPGKKVVTADVIIYGGTSAAVTAAVQLARMDKKVIIVCPDRHLGGMTSSGLGFTDTGNKSVIGGIGREFYQKVYSAYQDEGSWKWQKREEYGNVGQGTPAIDGDRKTMWIFEPHIAERIFEDFIREYKIEVFRDKWLDRTNGVEKKGTDIKSVKMLSGEVFEGKIFIDATYEGDLMAAAGISYHIGREPGEMYNEKWNGVQKEVIHHGHNFGSMNISPYIIPGDPASGVLPRISTADPGINGHGDNRLQAYCFRMCLTQTIENMVPFGRPENYDSTQYELLIRVLNTGWNETFQKFDPIPNHKTDVNNHGPFSFDNIGMNYDYPEASYERRKEIIEEHIAYQKGLLYFYANDPRIPDAIQKEMKLWGLAKDEFADNDNWPYQIYVREARRMKGEYVMTEKEVLEGFRVQRPVGMGSYTLDSHNAQRYITTEGYVQNEGDIGVEPKQPYQIDMGCILPQKGECRNLLVPVAVSSSHIAFGSIRMEPVFMILGQSAGIIAHMAIASNTGIHDLNYEDLKVKLLDAGQVLE